MRALLTDNRRTFNPRGGDLTARIPVGSFRPISASHRDPTERRPGPRQSVGAVAIIDNQRFLRKGIRVFLETDPEIKVVGEADSGEAGVALVSQLQPHVAVLDVMLPGMDGNCRGNRDSLRGASDEGSGAVGHN